MSRWIWMVVAVAACHAHSRTLTPLPLVTTGESSKWLRTGHYDEAVQLCHDFERSHAEVTCDTLGDSGEGRPIVALHVARPHARAVPVILIEAGIHAGEIEGKDAGLWFLRDLLDGKVAAGALDAVDVVFVPCINPDGHERFGPNNRPNQRGPVEMGFRTNGGHLNVNRDFAKADTPEIQAVLAAFRTYDPVLFVDIHTTDGAKFRHDISINVAPLAPRGDQLDETAHALSDALVARMTALGHLPLAFYPSFQKDDDPASGFAIGEPPPRFSQAYAAARSKLGFLVENHSWRSYDQRVHATYHFLQALLEQAATRAPAWSTAAYDAHVADLALRGHELAIVWDNGPHERTIDFLGYAYERRASQISGAPWIVYDESKPDVWHVPLKDELVPKVTITLPSAGYVIDGGFARQVAAVLDRHGIRHTRLAGQPRIALDAFRATKATFQPPYEGHTRVDLEGAWARETRTLDQGAIFVTLDQPNVRLIAMLLDPASPDSLAQWGMLTPAFERKEYMEAYVAEELARAMLAKDPGLQAQFDAALAADPELAKSPDRRLEWFYRRSPAWDERVNLLPVYKVDVAP